MPLPLIEIISIEDDTGPKFMHEKHPDDLNDVNWHGGEWLDWMETMKTPTLATENERVPAARNVRDYVLRLGPSGEMEMPSPDTHGTGGNWASPLAKLVQIAWGVICSHSFHHFKSYS